MPDLIAGLTRALQPAAAAPGSRTFRENWLVAGVADRAFPAAVAELGRWAENGHNWAIDARPQTRY
jgi:hypothetical protein